jgi:protein TonB
MFENLVESAKKTQRRRLWVYFTSTATMWSMLMTGFIGVSIMAYDANMGELLRKKEVFFPIPPPASGGPQNRHRSKTQRQVTANIWDAIKDPPVGIKDPVRVPPIVNFSTLDEIGFDFGQGDGTGNGIGIGVPNGPDDGVPPDPPRDSTSNTIRKDPIKQTTSEVINKSVIAQGFVLHRVEPIYPKIARDNRISGAVIVEVVISKDGNIESATALSGHPLLREAALKAARQWRWRSTTLNGVPVKVMGTITFNFNLN